jgi:hypothetical protein
VNILTLHGDHRPYFMDFDASLLFADPMLKIARPSGRILRLRDPRVRRRYTSALHDQLSAHNVLPRFQDLSLAMSSGTWSFTHTIQYESLDNTIIQSMLLAEKKAGRIYTSTYSWSPILKQSVQAYRYWQLRLKQACGLPVSITALNNLFQTSGLSTHPTQLSISTIQDNLRSSIAMLRSHQKHHKEFRKTFLEELSKAIALGSLGIDATDPHPTPLLATCSAKALKSLIHREHMRSAYRRIGYLLNPPSSISGLHKVDIPDSLVLQPHYGDPTDPKTWRGPWISITSPCTIATIIRGINIKQYNQAHHTPFGSGSLATLLVRQGDSQSAEALLAGQLSQASVLSTLLPETQRILTTLTTSFPRLDQPPIISDADFIATYNRVHENTSSSPSGRHVGHYKAILKDPSLVSMHATMMSLPFLGGFAPPRWNKVTDIMLEKEPGNSRCHRLSIIALFESDFNQAKRVLIARPITHHLEDSSLLNEMQYGSRPGKQCTSAVLKKVLCHDIIHQSKSSAAFMENDAVVCYDRLVNNLVLLILCKLGISSSTAKSIASNWDNVIHLIKTAYGTSDITYGSSPLAPLFGPGQGSTDGPTLWQILYWAITKSIDPNLSVARFISVCQSIVTEIPGISFVDDSNVGVTSTLLPSPGLSDQDNLSLTTRHLVQDLTALAQHWERLLFSTGGAINIQKATGI